MQSMEAVTLRSPTGIWTLTGFFLLALFIAPACALDLHTESVNASYPLTASFPGTPDRHLSLTVNTTLEDYVIYQRYDGYEQSTGFRTEATIMQTIDGGSLIPADRIIRSSVDITNLSQNLSISIKNYGPKFPQAGPEDTTESLSLTKIVQYIPSIKFIIIGVINPGYAVNEGIPEGALGILGRKNYQGYSRSDDYIHKEFDHRTGFFCTPANNAFIDLNGDVRSNYYDREHDTNYPDPGPVGFTYSYSVDYCSGDTILGFCPFGMERLTRTIEFSRSALPGGIDELYTRDHPFVITGSTTGVEHVQ